MNIQEKCAGLKNNKALLSEQGFEFNIPFLPETSDSL